MAGKGLVDSHPVKCPMVFSGMAVVLPKGAREMMGAGKVALRTEKHVIMVLVVQHGIDGAGRRHPDGTGGKPGIFVSVVGGFDLLVAVQHPLDGEVPQGEFQGGARLHFPAFAEAVDVHARNDGIFGGDGGLFLHDGGYCADFNGGESGFPGFFQPFRGPEPAVFGMHPLNEGGEGGVPVDLVGVGDKHGNKGGRSEAQGIEKEGVFHQGHEGSGIDAQLPVGSPGKVRQCADVVEGEGDGFLVARPEHVDQLVVAHPVLNAVTSCFDQAGVLFQPGDLAKGVFVFDIALTKQGLHDSLKGIAFANVDDAIVFNGGVGFLDKVVKSPTGNSNPEHKERQAYF